MNYITEKNNKVYVYGEIVSDATFSHEVYGEAWKTPLRPRSISQL